MTLFDRDGAIFSDCRKYRYVLWRVWDESRPMIAFVGLNPSTANESKNDPTIRRVISMAKGWGYGGVYMLNFFAIVTPCPEELAKTDDQIGDNDRYLEEYLAKSEKIVMAYGSFKEAKERAQQVIKMIENCFALHINKDGSPKHPLYVKSDTKLIPYTP